MGKSTYVKPSGESSLTGSKGLDHHEPVSKEFARDAADHVAKQKRRFSDTGDMKNEPETFGEHQQDEPGKRD